MISAELQAGGSVGGMAVLVNVTDLAAIVCRQCLGLATGAAQFEVLDGDVVGRWIEEASQHPSQVPHLPAIIAFQP
jgi:hypothetical protein